MSPAEWRAYQTEWARRKRDRARNRGWRRCRWCSVSMAGRRLGARWCSTKCRTYWQRRLDRLRTDRAALKPGHCRHCTKAIVQPRHSRRLYCSASCRGKAFYHANHVSKPRVYAPRVLEPLPRSYTGDAVFEEARKVLRFDRPGDLEDDILGEAVLAIVEGRDPQAAVRRYLAQEKAHRVRRVEGIDDIGYADGRIAIVWARKEAVA